MMERVPVTRAAHVIEFCDLFRSAGTPVEVQLRRNKLPEYLEENPDAFVNNILATSFVGRTAAFEGIDDVGWLAVRQFSESRLSSEINRAVSSEPTVFGRLKRFMQLSALEDSHLRMEVIANRSMVCVTSEMDIPEDTPGMSASNWTQVAVVLEVIRSVVGPKWAPSKITFKTDFAPCWDAQQAFGNTRIETGAENTALYFPREVLSKAVSQTNRTQPVLGTSSTIQSDLDWIMTLLRPYLTSKVPCLADAAEILGLSARTFQRRLRSFDTSYRELADRMRFETAVDRLLSSDQPVIEIAAGLGFDDQANFGRMFRRYAGVSPTAYRDNHA